MIEWFRKLIGRNPRLIEADRQLVELNNRVDALVERAKVDGESKWFLKVRRDVEVLPQTFECHEVKKIES